MSFFIGVMEKELLISIRNRTDNTMKVLWEESAFISTNGTTQRIIHSGVNYLDRNKPQSPSIIPGGSVLNDHIVPVGNVSRLSGSGDIIIESLLSWKTIGKYQPGTTIGLLLPVQILDNTIEYLITFELEWVYDNPEIRNLYLDN